MANLRNWPRQIPIRVGVMAKRLNVLGPGLIFPAVARPARLDVEQLDSHTIDCVWWPWTLIFGIKAALVSSSSVSLFFDLIFWFRQLACSNTTVAIFENVEIVFIMQKNELHSDCTAPPTRSCN